MGKAKKRIIARGKHFQLDSLSREDAIEFVLNNMSEKNEVNEVISLFGLRAEELLEAGADYESVLSLGSLIK